jgi:hypothetical protein
MESPDQLTDPEEQNSGENKPPLSQTAQMVMRVGDRAVVVMHVDEFKRITHPFTAFSQFLFASPLLGAELVLFRDNSSGREISLQP